MPEPNTNEAASEMKPAPEADERDPAEIAALAEKRKYTIALTLANTTIDARLGSQAADVTRDDASEKAVEKSEGQLVLERLLAVCAHMGIVGGQLQSLKHAIGLPVVGCAGGAPASGREVSQFLPALRLLADRMEEQLTSIDGSVNDIAKAF
ncbi:hypothetical protein [Rhodopseudomonas sp. BR0G17]|uniref:hypothetical protein n=1 Tax=Rhodopseudomonas sp. BR0G17 TaxID=2269368 RepID=UPI0013DF8BF4|nr:hypothetical protein [Rhodopseudomonas sp. BR0G17]